MVCCRELPAAIRESHPHNAKGRSALASKAVLRAQVLEKHQPYASVLKQRFWGKRCVNCYSLADSSAAVKLLRCSRCLVRYPTNRGSYTIYVNLVHIICEKWIQAASYCSKGCQHKDWRQHRHICAHLKDIQRMGVPDDDFDDILLLIITLNLSKITPDSVCVLAAGDIHICGSRHIAAMCTGGGYFDDALIRMISIVSELMKERPEAVASMYARFRSNNFGVMDELMNCVAVGIYPRAALLNHSCEPNCLLRYEFTENGPHLSIIALKDIDADEELTHSYCDSTSPRAIRQRSLRAIHGFTCDCFACTIASHPTDQLANHEYLVAEQNALMDKIKAFIERPLLLINWIREFPSSRELLHIVVEMLTTELVASQVC